MTCLAVIAATAVVLAGAYVLVRWVRWERDKRVWRGLGYR